MRNFLCALFIGFFSTIAQAQVTLTLTAPAEQIRPGQDVAFRVRFFNETKATVPLRIADVLPAKLLTDSGKYSAELKRHLPSLVQAEQLAPGAFVSEQYELHLPESAIGTVVIELNDQTTARSVILVTQQKEDRLDREMRQSSAPTTKGAPTLESGLAEYLADHLSPHEPMYVVGGGESPNIKFQVSMKYRIFNPDASHDLRWLRGFHIAYTQTTLWDLKAPSAPFFDSSYRPELLYAFENLELKNSKVVSQVGLQGGYMHESNGKSEGDSRSVNIVYVRPFLRFGPRDKLNLTVAPRVWAYVSDLADNPDMKDFRGYGDLRLILKFAQGLELSALGRMGDDWNRGSVQLDATYPLDKLFPGFLDVYFQAQYFNGYGESLLDYNKRGDALRFGIAIVR